MRSDAFKCHITHIIQLCYVYIIAAYPLQHFLQTMLSQLPAACFPSNLSQVHKNHVVLQNPLSVCQCGFVHEIHVSYTPKYSKIIDLCGKATCFWGILYPIYGRPYVSCLRGTVLTPSNCNGRQKSDSETESFSTWLWHCPAAATPIRKFPTEKPGAESYSASTCQHSMKMHRAGPVRN